MLVRRLTLNLAKMYNLVVIVKAKRIFNNKIVCQEASLRKNAIFDTL